MSAEAPGGYGNTDLRRYMWVMKFVFVLLGRIAGLAVSLSSQLDVGQYRTSLMRVARP
jgi:hypothetical protein